MALYNLVGNKINSSAEDRFLDKISPVGLTG